MRVKKSWAYEPSIKVWQLAAMIHGVDPDEMCDMVINDDGDTLDFSTVQDALLQAILANELNPLCSSDHISPSPQTSVTKVSALKWLEAHDCKDLADHLCGSTRPPMTKKNNELFGEYESIWPSIREDFKRNRENGLDAAKCGHGIWDEVMVLAWARDHGKIKHGANSKVKNSTWCPT